MGIILIVTKEPEDDDKQSLIEFNNLVTASEVLYSNSTVKSFYSFGDHEGDVIELVDTLIEQIQEEGGSDLP